MKYLSPEFTPALAGGKTSEPVSNAVGGVKAVGKIVFTGNILADDTVTINGVVFTAMASGAAGELQFDVGGTLSDSLDALITKLNACTNPLVSVATYTKTDTNTAVTATYDTYAAAGNSMTLASDHDSVVVTAMAGGQDLVTFSPNLEHIQFSFGAGVAVNQRFALPSGQEGQRRMIVMVAKAGAGNAVVDVADLLGGTTLTFDAANEHAFLYFAGGKWRPFINTSSLA